MVRTIAICSGKGGTGKTMLVANLGIALANLGKKVIMVDADLDMANLELALGMEGRPITLQDVMAGEANVQDVMYNMKEGAKLVPAGISPSQLRKVDPEKFSKAITELTAFADIVLLDCPAGIGKDTIACLGACKETVLIITPEPMAATDAYKTIIVAEKMGSEIIGIVVNMVRNVKNELKDKEITSLLGLPILLKIDEDAQVRESILSGKPLVRNYPSNPTSIKIKKLASDLAGIAYIPEKPKKSLLEILFGFFKKR